MVSQFLGMVSPPKWPFCFKWYKILASSTTRTAQDFFLFIDKNQSFDLSEEDVTFPTGFSGVNDKLVFLLANLHPSLENNGLTSYIMAVDKSKLCHCWNVPSFNKGKQSITKVLEVVHNLWANVKILPPTIVILSSKHLSMEKKSLSWPYPQCLNIYVQCLLWWKYERMACQCHQLVRFDFIIHHGFDRRKIWALSPCYSNGFSFCTKNPNKNSHSSFCGIRHSSQLSQRSQKSISALLQYHLVSTSVTQWILQ